MSAVTEKHSVRSGPGRAVLAAERRSPVLAHHGGGVEYFMDQTRGPVTGVVTGFAFTFPHPYIEFDVKDGTGNDPEMVGGVPADPHGACGKPGGREIR